MSEDDLLNKNQIVEGIENLSLPDQKEEVAKVAFNKLDAKKQEKIIKENKLESPTQKVTDHLWKVALWTIATVFGIAAASIIYAVVIKGMAANELQIVLTIFTSTLAFITGVFVPSPTQKNQA